MYWKLARVKIFNNGLCKLLAIVVEDNSKAPFSIATTPMCKGGRYFFPSIHTLYCCVQSKEVSSIIFKLFDMTRPGIKPRSPEPLANNQP